MDFDALARPELASLSAYAPSETEASIRLDANEAPDLLPESAKERVRRALTASAFNRYPDARQSALRQSIARRMGVSAEQVVAGTGSDELISLLLQTFSRPAGRAAMASVVTVTPSFSMYKHSAATLGQRAVEVPLDAGWDLDVKGLLRAVELASPNLIFLASPNNPTAACFDRARVDAVVRAASKCLVVLDEAYVDYADQDLRGMLDEHENVIVMRTLSKIGFAALRVGWIVAPAPVVERVDKVRQPFNLSTPVQQAAVTVLDDLADEQAALVAQVVAERHKLQTALSALGFGVDRSDANFLWVKSPTLVGPLVAQLDASGIRIRSYEGAVGRLANRVRITVGTPCENERLIQAVGRIMKDLA